MANESASEAGLHEYVDAQIVVADLKTPAQEQTMRDLLEKIDGVKALSIRGQTISVNYEPVIVSEKELHAAIERAGFKVTKEQVTSSSPMTDAFTPHDSEAPE